MPTLTNLPDVPVLQIYSLAADKLAHIKSLLITGRLLETRQYFIAARTLIELLPESYARQFATDWYNDLIHEAQASIQKRLKGVPTR